jgi:hypothetical protein
MSAGFMYGSPPSENVLGAINESATKYVDAVCGELDIEVSEVISHNRNRLISDLRHVLMYVLRNEFDMTFSEVGSFLHRDHATAIHGTKKIQNLLDTNQITVFLGQCLQAAEHVYNSQWGQNPKSISSWQTTKKCR